MNNWRPCWDCKYQNIYEDGYEWLACRCKKDGEKYEPSYMPSAKCENFEKQDEK